MNRMVTKDDTRQGRPVAYSTVAFAIIILLSFTPGLHAADSPVLMILEHVEANAKIETKIETKSGLIASPFKGKPQEKWSIRPGEALTAESRPGERVVNFFQGTGIQSTLLFIVRVRYFQNSEGKWVPQFQLNEEPLVVRGKDGRWKPLTTIHGVPNLIVQTGTALPNAEGYSTALELGFTTGATPIDAWQVQ